MSYLVFSRKHRPQTFDELWAQDHVKFALKSAVDSGRISHAYLFAGPRGVGKTTTARILAKSLNCLTNPAPSSKPCNHCSACLEITASRSLDVLEIDGASNRGIDEVRNLRENIKYTPAHGRFKVYVIDEVHSLTKDAFNALLKTLEEPPAHVVFVLATTEPAAVPPTILSRCQRFDFRRVPVKDTVARLAWIVEQEKLTVSEDALYAIARRADGSLRDAESILDQLAACCGNEIGIKQVEDLLGLVPDTLFRQFALMVKTQDKRGIVRLVNDVLDQGFDLAEFYRGLTEHYRRLLLLRLDLEATLLGLAPADRAGLREQADRYTPQELAELSSYLHQQEYIIHRSLLPKPLLEIIALRMVAMVEPGEAPARAAGVSEESRTLAVEPVYENAGEIWAALAERVRARNPILAGSMDLGTPLRLEDDVFYVRFGRDRTVNKEMLDQSRSQLEQTLAELLHKPTRLALEVAEAAEGKSESSDDMVKRITELLGGEEVTRR